MDRIEFKGGQWVMSNEDRHEIDALLARVGQSGETDVHKLLAQRIIPPIKQTADYLEWTRALWVTQDIGYNEVVRIAVDNPSMIALYTSPNGQVFYTRPGRTTYVAPEFEMIDCGLEIGWDDMAAAGWDIFGEKVKEAGEELARKRDTAAQTVLDAACATVSGHAATVSGGAMTKASVDAIFRLAATANWNIQTVLLNSGDVMDMTDWVWTAANGLWTQNAPSLTDQILRQFYVSGYGGANWIAYHTVPASKIYFLSSPATMGAYRWRRGGMRTASDVDITKKVDRHTWDEKWGHYWGNCYSVWSLTIAA
jgi:hypothetical protein